MTNLRAYNLRGLGILQFSLRRISRLLVYKYNIYRRVKICTQGKYRQMNLKNSTFGESTVRRYESCLSFTQNCKNISQ